MPIAVVVEKLEDDICLRASIGGNEKDGYYIRYRGDRKKVLQMLRDVAETFVAYQNIEEVRVSENTKFPIGKLN